PRLEGREHLLSAGFDQRAFRRRHRDSRRYAGADEVVNLDRGGGGASKSNGARSLLAAGRQLTVGDGLHRVASLRYDGSAADSEIPSAPAPVTGGYHFALLCGPTVVPAPGAGERPPLPLPSEVPRGRRWRRDGEGADTSA